MDPALSRREKAGSIGARDAAGRLTLDRLRMNMRVTFLICRCGKSGTISHTPEMLQSIS